MYTDVHWIWKCGQLLFNLGDSSSQVAVMASTYLYQQTFYREAEREYFGFVDCVVSVATSQLCHYKMKAATDNTQNTGCGCVSMKLYRY